ncbi:choice-of-anchor Q domain-containing protein, partial [Verrucomicrobiota bacterium]
MKIRAYFLTGAGFIPVLVCSLILSAILTQTASGLTNRYVVKGNGGAAIPYDTLGTAAADIQTAIDYAYAGETVLVAAATYDTGGITNWPSGGLLTNRVVISKVITLRSIDNNPSTTIIKGVWDPVTTNGPAAVRCVYMVNNSTLIGFMLTNGATITSNEMTRSTVGLNACGGGVCAQSASATISNCIVTDCSSHGDRYNGRDGGGMIYGKIFNCTIKNNSSRRGGGIHGNSITILSNCTISGNSAEDTGGGADDCKLYSCLVSNNSCILGSGGGLYDGEAFDCTFVSNIARYGGGAESCGKLYNCSFYFNTATNMSCGGAARQSKLYNCTVISNYSRIRGGGIASSTASNCVFIGNGVSLVNLYDCLIAGSTSSISVIANNSTILKNCTLVGNVGSIYADPPNTVKVYNCISWGNGSVDVRIQATNSCGVEGVWNNYANSLDGNFTNNPLFITDGSGYGANLTIGNYRLQTNSPCVNTGTNQNWMTNSVDLDGLPRILQYTVDRGAYESAHLFSFSPQTITNTVMRSFSTNITVHLTNSSPDIELYWGSTITSSWVTGPSSGNPIATNTSGTLTVTNSSGVFPLGTYASRMFVNALTNYPSAMAGYSQTGTVDMVMHVAEFARNPTQVTATVNQFGTTNTSVSIWNNGAGDIPFTVQTNVS